MEHGSIQSKCKASRQERSHQERRKEEEEGKEEKTNQKTDNPTDKKPSSHGREKTTKSSPKRKYASSHSAQGIGEAKKMAKNSNGSNARKGQGRAGPLSKLYVKTGQLPGRLTITPSCLRNLKERLEKITNVLTAIETKHMIKKPDTKKKTKAEKETQNLKSCKRAKTSVCKASPLSPSSSISSFQSGSGREDGQREEKTTPIDDFFSNHQQAKNYYYDTLSPTRARDGDARDSDARASSDVDLRVRGGDSSLFKDFPAYADLYSDFESELSSLSGRGENQGTSY